jgi:hypothetical protein
VISSVLQANSADSPSTRPQLHPPILVPIHQSPVIVRFDTEGDGKLKTNCVPKLTTYKEGWFGGNCLQEIEEADCYGTNHAVYTLACNNGRVFQLNFVYIKVVNIFVVCKHFTPLR